MADSVAQSPANAVPASLDHILLAIHDLEDGMDQFERLTGVRPQVGGEHPGRGTRNALVSLGHATYLEIYAPNPSDTAGPRVAAEFAAYTTLTPYDWAIRSEDLEHLKDSLGRRTVRTGEIVRGSRVRPDGARLQWSTLMVEEPAHQWIPFFIQWGAFSAHPATTSPMGCTLRVLRFEEPNPEGIREAFSRLGIDVSVTQAPTAAMRVVLACPKGTVEFPQPTG